MTAELPPVVPEERRQGERRADWHTPETCFKLLDVQTTMDRIFDRLKEGDVRMDSIVEGLEDSKVTIGCMQDNIAGNHRIVSDDIKSLEAAVSATQKDLANNTAKTNAIYDILDMGQGFFKGIAFIGKWFRRIVLWVASLAAALYTLWDVIASHK